MLRSIDLLLPTFRDNLSVPSSMVKQSSLLQLGLVLSYRRLGTTYRSDLQWSSGLQLGLVLNYRRFGTTYQSDLQWSSSPALNLVWYLVTDVSGQPKQSKSWTGPTFQSNRFIFSNVTSIVKTASVGCSWTLAPVQTTPPYIPKDRILKQACF
jgi:outer membrane receptor protein involved in Fe transport